MTIEAEYGPVSITSIKSAHRSKHRSKHIEPEVTFTVTEPVATITVTTTIFEDIYVDCSISKGKTYCTTASVDYNGNDWDYTSADSNAAVETGYHPHSSAYSPAQPTPGPYDYRNRYGRKL